MLKNSGLSSVKIFNDCKYCKYSWDVKWIKEAIGPVQRETFTSNPDQFPSDQFPLFRLFFISTFRFYGRVCRWFIVSFCSFINIFFFSNVYLDLWIFICVLLRTIINFFNQQNTTLAYFLVWWKHIAFWSYLL